jgi:hypothetical protein
LPTRRCDENTGLLVPAVAVRPGAERVIGSRSGAVGRLVEDAAHLYGCARAGAVSEGGEVPARADRYAKRGIRICPDTFPAVTELRPRSRV